MIFALLLAAAQAAASHAAANHAATTHATRRATHVAATGAAPAASKGRLVVLVVIDQLRLADLQWMGPEFGPRGFAGLGRPSPLRYESVFTETAPDHAVLSTGAYAELNGIVGNGSFTPEGKKFELVDDPACPVWGAPRLGKSAASLRAPTVGDAYKLNTNGAGKVVTVSVKDRSALFLAGTSADLALWFELETGEMVSNTCYAKEPPAWVPRHITAQFKDWVWTLSQPDVITRLVPREAVPGATPEPGFGPAFPHRVGFGTIDKQLNYRIRYSPAGNALVVQTARAAVKNLELGQGGRTDLLALSISSVDGEGHAFGSLSRERVDAVLRMNADVGAFLDELRAQFGPRLSVVLTADHGLTPMEVDQKQFHVSSGGTVVVEDLIASVNRALEDQLGPREGGWVVGFQSATLSLRQPYPKRAVDIAVETLRKEPGLWRVLTAQEIATAEPAVRHVYFPGRSGPILLVPRPLWTIKKKSDAADHGSPWNDDAVVPLLVQAPGFRLRREAIFRATQVAPTLAALLGTTPPAAAFDEPAVEHE